MKLTTADLPELRLSLVAALLMMAFGAAAIFLALDLEKSAQLAKAAASRSFKEFDGKLRQVRDEENEIKLKAGVFDQLQSRGIIGEEKRLDWVELLNSVATQRRLIDLEYEMSAQKPLDDNPGNEHAFYVSTMRLHLKLLHEEDLTRLLGDLRKQAKALILTRNCKVARLGGGPERNAGQANLAADCEIDWITAHATPKPGT